MRPKRPQSSQALSSIELFIHATGSVCTESLREATLPLCRPGENAAWQEDPHRARKGTRNKQSWSVMHISIWMFLNGHDVHRASFEWRIHLFKEMKPGCCKNDACWCYQHLWRNSPCLLPPSTRNAPWMDTSGAHKTQSHQAVLEKDYTAWAWVNVSIWWMRR